MPDFDLSKHTGRFVRPEQLAPYWGVHVETIRQWLRARKLKGAKVGRGWLIRTHDAVAFEALLFDPERTPQTAQSRVS